VVPDELEGPAVASEDVVLLLDRPYEVGLGSKIDQSGVYPCVCKVVMSQ
jgi:hypothetical protein